MPAIENPYINGVRHDFTTLRFMVGVTRYFEISELSYSDTLAPGKVRGTGAAIRGRTQGIYDAEGSVSMYKAEFQLLAQALQILRPDLGFGVVPFTISASYGKDAATLLTDVLIGCRIKKVDNSHKEGSDALMVKLDLDVLRIEHDGLSLVSDFPF
jgi:hypothetical protein